MDENNTYINKSEKEALEIMENVSDITSDQLQALRENEECFQTCSDIAEAVIGMQMEKNTLSINTQQALADFHRKHLDRRNKKLYILSFYFFQVKSRRERTGTFFGTDRSCRGGLHL